MAHRLRLGTAWFTVAVALLAGLPTLLYPLGRDQAVFLLAGRAVARGGFPYLDLWDIKPPGLFLAYTLPGSLPASGAWPVMLLDLAILGLSLLLIQIWLARLSHGPAGQAAGLMLAFLWLFAADYWDVGQAERLAIPLFLGLLLALEKPTTRRWALAGVCLGSLPLLKTSLVFLWPAALLWLPSLPPRRSWPTRRQLSILLGGALLPVFLVTCWLAWGGALHAALEATLSFTSHYTRLAWAQPHRLLRTAAGTSLSFLKSTWSLWLLALWGTRSPAADPRLRRLKASLWVALAGGAASILAQGKFFPYHWVVLWAPLTILAGLGAAQLATHLKLRPALAIFLPVLVALGLVVPHGLPGWRGWSVSARRLLGRMERPAQMAAFRVQGMGYDELLQTAHRATATTPAGTALYLWGFEPAFYVATQRPFPGRFPFSYPLVAPWAPDLWRLQFLAAWREKPPAIVLIRRHDPIPWVAGLGGDAEARLQHFPALKTLLARRYRPDATLSTRHLLALRLVAAGQAGR